MILPYGNSLWLPVIKGPMPEKGVISNKEQISESFILRTTWKLEKAEETCSIPLERLILFGS